MRGRLFVLGIAALLIASAFLSIAGPFRSAEHTRYEDITDSRLDLRDTDGDGLLDDQEVPMGLDPLDPDTDDDELQDGAEYIYWTDRSRSYVEITPWHRLLHGDVSSTELRALHKPLADLDTDGLVNILDRDSDDDGIPDGNELVWGTDPANPDSDGDGLLDYYDPGMLNSADRDRDGMPDDWEHFYGVDDPEADDDDDGVSNLEEYRQRTNPRSDRGTSDLYDPGDDGQVAVRPPDRVDPEEMRVMFYARTNAQSLYWKIATFDTYRPDGWIAGPTARVRGPEPVLGHLRHRSVTTDLTFVGAWTGYLPVLGHVRKMSGTLPPTVDVVPYRSGELEATLPVIAAAYVTAVYDLANATERAWTEGELEQALDSLMLPAGVSLDFVTLGAQLANETGPGVLQRAVVAAGYVYLTCRVVTSDKAVVPEGIDPASWVLFESEDHNGTHYDIASAYVLLARSMGVPTRLVVGYRGGVVSDDTIMVLKRNAWTWAEVLVPGMGWVRLDPSLPDPLDPDAFGPINGRPVEIPGVIRPPDGGWPYPPVEFPGGGNPWINPKPPSGSDPGWQEPDELDPEADLDGDGIPNKDDNDADGDGLTRDEEALYGSSDFNRDTDWDTLDDFTEVFITKTDPWLRDTDSDGLSDGTEVVNHHTNATNPDTDGGGVIDGTEVAAQTDPLDPSDDERAVDSDQDGLMDVVERELGTDPFKPDTDADGLTDRQEYVLGTDPLKPDTDGDGENDSQEVRQGTDPLDAASNSTTGPGPVPEDPPPGEGPEDPEIPPEGEDPTDPDPTDPNTWKPDPERPDPGDRDDAALSGGVRAVLALIAAMGLLGIYLAWRRIHVREIEHVLEIAEEELYRLDLDDLDAVRKVIIRAYVGFCEVLRRYDFLRKEAWTVREFEDAVRMALPLVPAPDLAELTWLFEEARYAVHELPEDYGYRAALALRGIRGSISPGLDLSHLGLQVEDGEAGRTATALDGGGEFAP